MLAEVDYRNDPRASVSITVFVCACVRVSKSLYTQLFVPPSLVYYMLILYLRSCTACSTSSSLLSTELQPFHTLAFPLRRTSIYVFSRISRKFCSFSLIICDMTEKSLGFC